MPKVRRETWCRGCRCNGSSAPIPAAIACDVALEINARYQIPSAAFIRMAKRAGAKFSFGSNTHSEEVGRLEYCVTMSKEGGLTGADMFMPNPERK